MGAIRMPRLAKLVMIRTSATEDSISQRLGRELHSRRRSRTT